MPVGFATPIAVTPSSPHASPTDPWELRFSRFVDEGGQIGAHSLTGGVGVRGAGITVAHMDTGYTDHPEILHGTNVRTTDARTFTRPAPSLTSLVIDPDLLIQATPHGGSVSASVAVSQNGLQVAAGASVWIAYPDDGRDTLIGAFPSHGTSTASLIMSGAGAPAAAAFPGYPTAAAQTATGFGVKTIVGGAPEARYLPVRISDTVVIDPVVANNMALGISHVAELAKTDPTIGVISISLGWPVVASFVDYSALAQAIDRATEQGVVICAAAGQSGAPLHPLFESWAQTAEQLAGTSAQGSAAALEAARVSRVIASVAAFTGLQLPSYQTVQDLCNGVIQLAQQANRSATQIAMYLRFVEAILQREARASRIVGGPLYPGTDLNTICCAGCDHLGNRLHDGLYGVEVDITAPAARTFSAKSVRNAQGGADFYVQMSDGTSFATALTAAACALWQSHHGRANLIARFGRPLMVHAFRWALKQSAATQTVTGAQTPWESNQRGFGILDAAALLQAPLLADADALIERLRSEGMISVETRALLRRRSGL